MATRKAACDLWVTDPNDQTVVKIDAGDDVPDWVEELPDHAFQQPKKKPTKKK